MESKNQLASVALDAAQEQPICGVVTEAETVNPSVEPLVEVAHPGSEETEEEDAPDENYKLIQGGIKEFMETHHPFVTSFNDGQNAVINIAAGIHSGKIKPVRVKINRIPLDKNVKKLAESMHEIGQQMPILVAPASAMAQMGFDLESFDGNPVSKKNLGDSLVVIDGQTRTKAYLQATIKDADKLFGVFVTVNPGMTLNSLLSGINLNAFNWSAQDYATAIIANPGAANRDVYLKIQELRNKGYNDTAADEWATGDLGTLRKGEILKEAQGKVKKTFPYASFFIKIHAAAAKKFGEGKGSPMLLKLLPEQVLMKWSSLRDDKGSEFATKRMITFLNSLSDDAVKEFTDAKSDKDNNKTKQQVFADIFRKYFDAFCKDEK